MMVSLKMDEDGDFLSPVSMSPCCSLSLWSMTILFVKTLDSSCYPALPLAHDSPSACKACNCQ